MVSIGYTRSLANTCTSSKKAKAYKSNSVAVSGNDSYVCAALAVEGLSGGTSEWLFVHSNCFGRTIEGRTGSGGEGTLLDWTALGNGATTKTLEKATLWKWIGVYPVAAQATMLAAIERNFMLSLRVLRLLDQILRRMR